MNFLQSLDIKILLMINGMNCSFLDTLMFWISETWFWIPLYIVLIYQIFRLFGKRGIVIIVTSMLVIAVCDQIASHLIKESVQRLRPSHEPGLNNLLHFVKGYRGGEYGFVSSHAANSFGLATFLFGFFKTRIKWLSFFLVFTAIIISYSRVYLGVHYPSDVIIAGILGVAIGWLTYILFLKLNKGWIRIGG